MPKNNRKPHNGVFGWASPGVRRTDAAAREAYNKYMRDARTDPAKREKSRLRCSAWRKTEKGAAVVRKNRLAKYGITPEIFDSTLAKQGNKCAICGSDSPANNRGWHVDHCHKTGRFRGLLCVPCNLGLGHFKDSLEILESAKQYLTR